MSKTMNEEAYVKSLIDKATDYAQSLSSQHLLIEHILYILMQEKKTQSILRRYKIDCQKIIEDTENYLKKYPLIEKGSKISVSKNIEFFSTAFLIANDCNIDYIKNKQILYILDALIAFSTMIDTYAYKILCDNKVDDELIARLHSDNSDISFNDRMTKAIKEMSNSTSNNSSNDATPIIQSILSNYSNTAKNPLDLYTSDYLTPYLKSKSAMIGRENEIKIGEQIIMRNDKPNLIIVGQNGVGKSKLVCEISKAIKERMPEMTFVQLDTYALTANVMLKGEIENRIKSIYDELKNKKGAILFIDNIHTICPSDDNTLQSTISSTFKSFMENTYIKIIGTTTPEDYRKSLEKDENFSKKFFKMMIDEPSISDTKQILKGIKKKYEKFSGHKFSSNIIDLIVDLSSKYCKGSAFPAKALDVLDMTGAIAKYNDSTIDENTVYKSLSSLLNIPLSNISQSEEDLYKNLENNIRQEIIGQDDAVKQVSDAVIISRSGLRETNKTATSLLFTGSSGVGKTELCRVLSKIMNIPLVRFDMSEYMEEHSVSKFLGAPPGYKDAGNGKAGNGLLINAIDEHPYCILLLDEIEKAHPKIHNLLLQVMDNGKITSSMGKSVSFEHVFLIMTSNVGSNVSYKKTIGFESVNTNEPMQEALEDSFLPEFRSRIDSTINFNNLNEDVMSNICIKFLEELKQLLKEKKITLNYSKELVNYITNKAMNVNNGARPMKHIITNEIKNVIAKEIVFGKYKNGGTLKIDVQNEEIVFGEK